MRAGIARTRVPAAIAEGVELLDIADAEPGLLLDPGAQSDLERTVRERVERAEGEPGAGGASCGFASHEDRRLLVLDRDDGRRQPDLDGRQRTIAHPCHAGYS